MLTVKSSVGKDVTNNSHLVKVKVCAEPTNVKVSPVTKSLCPTFVVTEPALELGVLTLVTVVLFLNPLPKIAT